MNIYLSTIQRSFIIKGVTEKRSLSNIDIYTDKYTGEEQT
jgi:hypothetical protein